MRWKYCLNCSSDPKENALIDQILLGNHRLRKMVGYPIYKTPIKTGDKLQGDRLLFVSIGEGENRGLILLPRLTHHHYKRYVKHILSHYRIDQELLNTQLDNEDNFQEEETAPSTSKVGTLCFAHPTPEPKISYYKRQLLVLDAEQTAALHTPTPALMRGSAGTGKTMILYELVIQLLEEESEDEMKPYPASGSGGTLIKPILYIAENQALVDDFNALLQERLAHHPKRALIQCLTYDAFLNIKNPQLTTANKVGFVEFQRWYGKQTQIGNAEWVYEGFREISAYFTGRHVDESHYLASSAERGLVPQPQRAQMLALYKAYQHFLNPPQFWDPAFHQLDRLNPEYHAILADEAPDFSPLQWWTLHAQAINGRIYFAGDPSYQRLHDRQSLYTLMRHLLQQVQPIHEITLNNSYRCPDVVLKFNQELRRLRNLGSGGTFGREETSLERTEGAPKEGVLKTFALHSQTVAEINEVLKSANACVVTRERSLKRAAALFKTDLIFTPLELKGQEYQHVVYFEMFWQESDETLKTALGVNALPKELQSRPEDAWLKSMEIELKQYSNLDVAQKDNGRVADKGNTGIIIPMNEAITAATRPTDTLLVVFSPNRKYQSFSDQLRNALNLAPPQASVVISPSELSHEAWKERMEELNKNQFTEKAKKIEHRVASTKSGVKHLHLTVEVEPQPSPQTVVAPKPSPQSNRIGSPPNSASSSSSNNSLFDSLHSTMARLNFEILSPGISSKAPTPKMRDYITGFLANVTELNLIKLFLTKNPFNILAQPWDDDTVVLEHILRNPASCQAFLSYLENSPPIVDKFLKEFYLDNGDGLIHLAAKTNAAKLIEFLTMYEPDVIYLYNMHDCSPLYYALLHQHPEATHALMKAGAKHKYVWRQTYYPMVTAIDYSQAQPIADNIPFVYTWFNAVRHGDVKTINELMQMLPPNDPLFFETCGVHAATALHVAAQHGQLAVVNQLINACPELLHIRMKNGASALFLAVQFNHVDVMMALILHGVPVDEALFKPSPPDFPFDTAIQVALYRGYSTMVEQLLSCNAEIEIHTKDGQFLDALPAILPDLLAAQIRTKPWHPFTTSYIQHHTHTTAHIQAEKEYLTHVTELITNFTEENLMASFIQYDNVMFLLKKIGSNNRELKPLIAFIFADPAKTKVLCRFLKANLDGCKSDPSQSLLYELIHTPANLGSSILAMAVTLGSTLFITLYAHSLIQKRLQPTRNITWEKPSLDCSVKPEEPAPIFLAIACNRMDSLKTLILLGVDLSKKILNQTALGHALKSSRIEMIKEILKYEAGRNSVNDLSADDQRALYDAVGSLHGDSQDTCANRSLFL